MKIITISTSVDMRNADHVEVFFSQYEQIIITKKDNDVIVNKDNVQVVLSEKEIVMFEPGRYVPVEVRAIFADGATIKSNVMYRPFRNASDRDFYLDSEVENISILGIDNDYVTPEMFGAKGDGATDDTQAVQKAFDSGKNVCFPLTSQYLITDTITINDIERTGRTAFSVAVTRYWPSARLFCSFSDKTHPVFKVLQEGWTFENVSIYGRNKYDNTKSLTLFDCDTGKADVDISFINCCAYSANTFIKIIGRGLSIQNCLFASCSRLLHIKWAGDRGGIYHDDSTGQRAYVIENNRIHSFGREAASLIYVESGNVFGMRFAGNNLDRGYTSFLSADTALKNWVIENNTFHGMGGTGANDAFINLENGADGLIFAGNTFVNAIESSYYFTNLLVAKKGNFKKIVIANNNFGTIINGSVFVVFSTANADGLTIIGNIVENMKNLSTQRGLLYLSTGAPAKNVTIIGNIIMKYNGTSISNKAWIIRASGGLNLDYAKVIGNVIYESTGTQLSFSGEDYSSNCMYDWNFSTQS